MSDTGTNDADKGAGILRWMRELHALLPGFMAPLVGFSIAINVLMLVVPLYMLQVYDRILTSGSTDTLIWLTVISVFLLAIYGAAEAGRRRLTALAAQSLDDTLADKVFDRFEQTPYGGATLADDEAHLGRIRNALQNNLLSPLFDVPFAPLFLLALFVIHPVIGLTGVAGAIIVFAIATIAEMSSRRRHESAFRATAVAQAYAIGLGRQRSALVAMGLGPAARGRLQTLRDEAQSENLSVGAHEGWFTATSRSFRHVLQILILGVGAALAISQQVSPGAIVAGSILMSRALAPIDQLVGTWRSLMQTHAAWRALAVKTAGVVKTDSSVPLPRPNAALSIERLAVATPDRGTLIVRPFSLMLTGGDFLCVAGDVGAGKSTLLQTLAGVWPAVGGSVQLGGRSIHAWANDDRGQHVGYVPQDIGLLPETIFSNIGRLQDTGEDAVYAAARKAGAHDMILSLPDGYDTRIGDVSGGRLSVGQRQLISLARAFFGTPVLLLLDEPTANLDGAAAERVVNALQAAAQEGAIVVAVTHDPRLMAGSKNTLLIRGGNVLHMPSREFLTAGGRRTAPVELKQGSAA